MSDLTPDQVEQQAENLRQWAALAGEYWDALKAARLPDDLAVQLVVDWHWALTSWGDTGDDQ